MQQSPQLFKEISLLKNNLLYYVHKSDPLIPFLDQINTVHTFQAYFFHIHFNIIPPFRLGLPDYLPSEVQRKTLYAFLLFSSRYMPSPFYTFQCFHLNNILCRFSLGITCYDTVRNRCLPSAIQKRED